MPAKVTIRDLRKNYGNVQAVRGVSFDVHAGEIFGLLGPNGAGKTTTLECILGLRQPDGGTITVCGFDVRQRPREVRQRIGAVLQDTALQDKITPREALYLFGSFYRNSTKPEALLERFSLADKADAAFGMLSGGQRQRLALALAFVNDPEVVFLDEPTAGLDLPARRGLHTEINMLKQQGRAIVLTTHYMDEAEKLCDRVAIIARGQILAAGPPRALIAGSGAMPQFRLETSHPIDADRLARLPGVQGLTCEGTQVRFRAPDITRALAELVKVLNAEGVDVAALGVEKAGLEDVFLELTSTSQPGNVVPDRP